MIYHNGELIDEDIISNEPYEEDGDISDESIHAEEDEHGDELDWE